EFNPDSFPSSRQSNIVTVAPAKMLASSLSAKIAVGSHDAGCCRDSCRGGGSARCEGRAAARAAAGRGWRCNRTGARSTAMATLATMQTCPPLSAYNVTLDPDGPFPKRPKQVPGSCSQL